MLGFRGRRVAIGRLSRAGFGFLRANFASFGEARIWPRWKELRPLLLRSAGAVGLAGVIVAIISNDGLFRKAEPQRQAHAAVQHQAIEPTLVAAISVHDASDVVAPRPGVFARPAPAAGDAAGKDPARISADPAAAIPVKVALAPADDVARAPPDPPEAEDAAVRSPAPTPSFDNAMDAPAPPPPAALVRAAAARAADSGRQPPAQADCPRDWIRLDGIGEVPAGCGDAAALIDLAAVPEGQRAIEDAALERASELAGLQFAPRIPKLRPEPPPTARAKKSTRSRKTAASWPAGSPPDCGRKYARWRYVDKVPTWYCK